MKKTKETTFFTELNHTYNSVQFTYINLTQIYHKCYFNSGEFNRKIEKYIFIKINLYR